jgi:hypothetical protein
MEREIKGRGYKHFPLTLTLSRKGRGDFMNSPSLDGRG